MKKNVINDKQDLTWLIWSKTRNSSGTAGSFLKSYSDLDNKKVYYKLSNYDPYLGIVGHECVNEIIVDRLLDILNIEHLSYQLVHADVLIDGKIIDTFLCKSEDFKQPNESKIALDAYYQAERINNESPLHFCLRNNFTNYIYQMLVVDYLILNRDRHGANIEVLRNNKTNTIRLAPLFDHGLSLLFQCHDEKSLASIDVLEDKPIQCFVGSRSSYENLKLIPIDKYPKINRLKDTDRELLFDDLENVINQTHQDKIWEMITERWKIYEDICDKR